MGVPRGTTPTFTLTLDDEDLDLTAAQTVIVSFSNREVCLEKQGNDITVRQKEIDVFLSQEETLAFLEQRVDIQVNWILVGGIRCASTIASYTFGRQLLDRVVE